MGRIYFIIIFGRINSRVVGADFTRYIIVLACQWQELPQSERTPSLLSANAFAEAKYSKNISGIIIVFCRWMPGCIREFKHRNSRFIQSFERSSHHNII